MWGIQDGWILLAYLLCIASAALCVVYGLVNWRRGDDSGEAAEATRDAEWAAEEKKLVLFQGAVPGGTDGLEGIHILQWDGADLAGKVKLQPGAYRVRWTVADGYREFPVTLAE